MICPYCGESLKDTAKFCTNCGQKQPLSGAETVEMEPAAGKTAEAEPETGAGSGEAVLPEEEGTTAEPAEEKETAEESAGAEPEDETEESGGDTIPEGTTEGSTEDAGTTVGLTARDVICTLLSIAMLLWINRLAGIAALIFAIRAYVKRRNGDEEKAQNSRKICVILLLIGVGLFIIGKILKLIFRIGAFATILSWFTRFTRGLLWA